MHYVVTMSQPPDKFPDERDTARVQALDIDMGGLRTSWKAAAAVVLFLASAASWAGSFVAQSAKKTEVAPIEVVAKVNANERSITDVKQHMKAIDAKVGSLTEEQRRVLGKLDLLLQSQWERANPRERRAMRKTSSRIAESAGADPLSGIEE